MTESADTHVAPGRARPPAAPLAEERAAQIARDAEAAQGYPRPASAVYEGPIERRIPAFDRGYSSLDVAATLVAAVMTLGPLFGGYITNLHS